MDTIQKRNYFMKETSRKYEHDQIFMTHFEYEKALASILRNENLNEEIQLQPKITRMIKHGGAISSVPMTPDVQQMSRKRRPVFSRIS